MSWVIACVLAATAASSPIVYVDADATGGNDGSSWQNAFVDLRTALLATSGGEIWIAEGRYLPGATPSATFALKDGVAMLGGFAGTEQAAWQRDPVAHETILSGDLQGDDIAGWGGMSDNALHVVTAANVGPSAVLDGVIVERGRASTSSGASAFGAGLTIDAASPTLRRCVVRDNLASSAAGMVVVNGGSPRFSRCEFRGNHAWSGRGGGGYLAAGAAVDFEDCVFTSNLSTSSGASGGGGALFVELNATLHAKRCAFFANRADYYVVPSTFAVDGGAVVNLGTGVRFEECEFRGNRAHDGGAVWTGRDVAFVNCVFAQNRAEAGYQTGGYGGAIIGFIGAVRLESCTLAHNVAAEDGGALYLAAGAAGTIENSIVAFNTSTPDKPILKQQIQKSDGVLVVRYSDVLGLLTQIPGEDPPDPTKFPGSIDADPRFVTSVSDLALAADSPCVDRGSNALLGAENTHDVLAHPRRHDDPVAPDLGSGNPPLVDMGAYERGSGLPSLAASAAQISLSSGGAVDFELSAGTEHGERLYFLLGSASGVAPGTPLGPVLLPLNVPDPYFALTIALANQAPLFTGTVGFLDALGAAHARLTLPSGTTPSAAGIVLAHAFVVAKGTAPVFASDAVTITLVP
jgi:hypothetical protein